MVGQLGEKTGGDPQADGALNMITSMMGGLNGNGGSGTPDIAGMMSGIMGGLNGKGGTSDIAGMMSGMMGGLMNGGQFPSMTEDNNK